MCNIEKKGNDDRPSKYVQKKNVKDTKNIKINIKDFKRIKAAMSHQNSQNVRLNFHYFVEIMHALTREMKIRKLF